MNEKIINEIEIRKAIQVLKPDGELFEVRIIGSSSKPMSGYFKNADALIQAFGKVDLRDTNIYITINQIDNSLASRKQANHFIKGATSTSDNDVNGYEYLFIDLDPQRSTGISSSREEYLEACQRAKNIAQYLENLGFEKPIKAVSGNGAHLLYRIKLANNDKNKKLVERCLKALALLFNDDVVQVDTSNFNPSRVCKLYGTLAQKGADTEERPHRMSRIFEYPDEVKVTDIKYLEKLSKEYPEEKKPTPSRYNNYNTGTFDVEEWMNRYNIRYKEGTWRDGCKKYILEECPFDNNHKAPDSMILVQSNGAIGFKCLHNSCADKTWRDVRLMFEPDAYDKPSDDDRIERGWKEHNKSKKVDEVLYEPIRQETLDEPMFETIKMIFEKKEEEEVYIKTCYNEIDRKMRGLQKGCISVVSGLRGSAKSTWLSNVGLNAVNNNQTVIVYSGELSDQNFAKWYFLQAAGKSKVVASKMFENAYYVPENIKEKISDWTGEKLWLYNNKYGNDFNMISKVLVEKIKERQADLVILDNLMALNLEMYDRDKYEAQTKFVQSLKNIANLCNVHIIFVAHPRKAMGFLRLDDISGSGNITNYVDNAFIVHRRNEDFKRLGKQMFGWKDDHYLMQANVTNVVEICKDRNNGNQDVFIPLYYEPETKRLKNTPVENVIYGWNTDADGFTQLDDDELRKIPF